MGHILRAFEIALNEGETWDDPMTLNMTREQANILLASTTMTMQQVGEGLDAARRGARNGDLSAMLAEPALLQSAEQLQGVLRIVAQACDPVAYAAVMDAAADADEVGTGA